MSGNTAHRDAAPPPFRAGRLAVSGAAERPAQTGSCAPLSPRLARLAAWVTPGSVVIDVGTDHAYIPIWLLQSGLSPRAYASDIKAGPLRNAAAGARRCGVEARLTLYLCDGLSACAPDSVDTVLIAGMGGETIQGILAAAPWALDKRLIVQAQTKQESLRRWLGAQGMTVLDAALVHDAGRIYVCWLLGRGKLRGADWPLDPVLVEKKDPLLRAYTEERIKRTLRQLQGMEQGKATDSAALEEVRRTLSALRELHREAETWQA